MTIEEEVSENKGGTTTTKIIRKQKSVGRWWLSHTERRQYEGVIFDPSKPKEANGYLNIWNGFAVTPIEGDWNRIKHHIRDVLACGNEEHAQYITNWLAWGVQNPDKPIGVALVFKGGKGTGKSLIGNLYKSFFGAHGIQLSAVSHLTGNFNSHLGSSCFVFCDEAFWGGDKGNDGQLKRLITEPELAIERKHKDLAFMTNRLKVMMASNEHWVVPATQGERRYAVFEVSSSRKGDNEYFDDLISEISDGGAEAMLNELMHMDLTNFNPRVAPETEALLLQQEEGLSPLDSWFREILECAFLPNSSDKSPNFAYTRDLLDLLKSDNANMRLFVDAKKLGRYLKDKGCIPHKKANNMRGYMFPDLQELRADWERAFPLTKWEEECGEWQPDPASLLPELSEYLIEAGISS